MPYPNEHAARVRNPDSFEPTSFRSKELKGGVRLILGKLKNGNSSMVVQAYRFSLDNFTIEQAKQWLEDNKIKYIKFELAKPVSESGGVMEDKIEHAGVLGMRWGIRRGSSRTSRRGKIVPSFTSVRGKIVPKTSQRSQLFRNKSKKINSSEDFKTAVSLKKKHVNELSNDEVSKVVRRMELEKRYKDLNPSKVAKGQKRVKTAFSSIGKVAGVAGSIAALATVGKTLWDKMGIDSVGGDIAKGLTG